MERVLFDTNIILDVALKRMPHFELASELFEMIDRNKVTGHVTASTITDIYYISKKQKGHKSAIAFISSLIEILDVIGVDKETIINALRMDLKDFEDSIQVSAAQYYKLDCIITRNKADFEQSYLKVFTPKEYLFHIRG
ncbi:type II toxin-antitoxin system VapC family toxin [Rhodohalobacter sp. 8-1]|uniref:type II toxin-antitoxin system VapC family toxin n=1 Tax=Rhodohalobacter sp. 8-1 TaxID=3131972 RepID=UPI0030EE2595